MLPRQFKQTTLLLARVGTVVLIALALGTTTHTVYAAAPAKPRIEGEATTPYQSALAEAVAERQAAGLPVPSSVTFDVQRTDGAVKSAGARGTAAPTVSVTATTTIEFANPQQAGYDEWPALVVKDNLPEAFSGKVMAGDYTEAYREKLAEQIPGVWETYEFGQEPRIYTTTETINITYPPEELPQNPPMYKKIPLRDPIPVREILNQGQATYDDRPESTALNYPPGMPVWAPSAAATGEDILTGFTYSGPHIDYTIGDRLEICLFGICGEVYDFKAGFELDWAMGLRLPAHATLAGPDEMRLGGDYNLTTSLTPLDWSAEQYTASGVAPENGNEFALRLYFFAGLRAEIIGIDLCPNCYAELDFDESESFTTPFGSEAEFPIPSITIPIYSIDIAVLYFGLGLTIDPHLTSTMLTADWTAVPGSDCSGSGSVTYAAPGAPVTFGLVTAGDIGPSDRCEVRLDNFRYWFNEFVINLLADLDFRVFGYGAWHPTINIASIDLSSITGGLYLSDHVQCDWAFSCSEAGPDNTLLLSIPVSAEPPPVIVEPQDTQLLIDVVARPRTAQPGDVVSWTITVTNPASVPSEPVTITGTIPAGLRPLPSTLTTTRGAASLDGQVLAVTGIGSLQPGDQLIVTMQTELVKIMAALADTAGQSSQPAQTLCFTGYASSISDTDCVNMPLMLPPAGSDSPLAASMRGLTLWGMGLVIGLSGLVWVTRRQR
jgi:uncharacterized repeat protein (TIGR01451 family)